MDLICAVCAEPWDSFGVHSGEGDLSPQEYRELVLGRGCPECGGRRLCRCGHAHADHGGVLATESCRYQVGGESCECSSYRPQATDASEAWQSSLADNGEAFEDWERLQGGLGRGLGRGR